MRLYSMIAVGIVAVAIAVPYLACPMHQMRVERAQLMAAIERGRCKAAFRHIVRDTTLPGALVRQHAG